MKKIRVLIVDDSAFMRKVIPTLLTLDPDIDVVGTAMDGKYALEKIPKLKPDIIILDLYMPRMDGLTALPEIVRRYRLPVLVFSSLTQKGADMTFKALQLGAVDFISKPASLTEKNFKNIAHDLTQKVRSAASVSKRKIKVLKLPDGRPLPELPPKPVNVSPDRASGVLALGISTGGPNTLTEILPQLAPDFPAGLLIVQHMPEGFTKLFADRMNDICRVPVKEAEDGDRILQSQVLIAPGHAHMEVKRIRSGYITVLNQSPRVSGHRPSVDVLFNSVARTFGEDAVGIIMTGMGDDGVEGLAQLQEAGAATVAQDEKTSVIFGMPKAAIRQGCVGEVVSKKNILPRALKLLKERDLMKTSEEEEVHPTLA